MSCSLLCDFKPAPQATLVASHGLDLKALREVVERISYKGDVIVSGHARPGESLSRQSQGPSEEQRVESARRSALRGGVSLQASRLRHVAARALRWGFARTRRTPGDHTS